MALQCIWYFSDLPKEVIDSIEKDTKKYFEPELIESRLYNDKLDKTYRNSRSTWIPSTHWISGFMWHYVLKANRENFLYDVEAFDGETLQYTNYGIGEFYNWHNDDSIANLHKPASLHNHQYGDIANDFIAENCQRIRKLSIVLQLSDPEDYDGGQVQLMDENGGTYFLPKKRGSVIVFDSRTKHRVLKVRRGIRKSIVGWVVGPRWR